MVNTEICIVIFGNLQRYKGEDNDGSKDKQHKYCALLLEEVMHDRAPVGIVGITDALGIFSRMLHKTEQIFLIVAHLDSSFFVSVILGSMAVISTSPKKVPRTPRVAYSSDRVWTIFTS